ncbi:MAG: hypothetical protein EPN79_11385 [Burkholderiaceae bacterium]|nr:MAG: hypothetical protein EPN79_11385 [Burkholderiaceae bacterium]TBR76713.1 MAG: hypothetical protein EPN64_05685 [Burkholderiaceae bacterium]
MKHQIKSGKMLTSGDGRKSLTTPAATVGAAENLVKSPAPAKSQALNAPADKESPVEAPAHVSVPAPFAFGFHKPQQDAGKSGGAEPAAGAAREKAPEPSFQAGAGEVPASKPATPQADFSKPLASLRETANAKASIATVRLLARLLGAVATRPGVMADVETRTSALRTLYRQAREMGDSIAIACSRSAEVPGWLHAQATDAAATALCKAWESGMSQSEVEVFNAALGNEITEIARQADAVAGSIGFDGYIPADSPETAQGRLYVSITSAIGRLNQAGIPAKEGGECVMAVLEHLEGSENHAGMKMDMRTAWLQGSLGRCTDLMVSIIMAQSQPPQGVSRLAHAQSQALILFHEVEKNAKLVLERRNAPRDAEAESQDHRSGPVPRG